jgi:uncharacterized membrane protein YtjA (UPF0391 family)
VFVFLIIAEVFGFSGVAGESAWIANVLFVIFVVMFIVSFFFRGRPRVERNEAGGRRARIQVWIS